MQNVPAIICAKGESRKRILTKYPDLELVVTEKLNEQTVIVVDNKISKTFVVDDNTKDKGMIHVSELSFEYMLTHLRSMISALRNGMAFKDAIALFVSSISEANEEKQ